MRKPKDITDQRFGRWTVVAFAHNRKKHPYWKCICDCGNKGIIEGGSLRAGRSKSCGCLNNEVATARLTTHGMADTPEYKVWVSMLTRCFNKKSTRNFHLYGGRGITVTPRWRGEHGFENFYADMGPRPSSKHTVERIKTDGHYEPSNCCWATHKEQNRNRRNNRLLTYNGQTLSLAEWAESLGMSQSTLRQRLVRGWSVERSLTEPVHGL